MPCRWIVAVFSVLPLVMFAVDAPLVPTAATYRTFNNQELALYAWKGRHVAFLTAGTNLDAQAMTGLVATFDRVRDFYHEATGRDPAVARQLDGLTTVAEVPKTCGAACGYLGATGIELTPGVFRELYDGFVARGEIDQAPPYEFGRNFWFYSPQLAPKGASHQHAFITGYAVFMRFPALDAAGAKVGRFRDRSGEEFRACVEGLVDLYEADPGQHFTNTLALGHAPKNPLGLNGTDLFASFCMRLCRTHGGPAYARKLWREVGTRPAAVTAQDAIDNFVLAASAAARSNLTTQFTDLWRWPVSTTACAAARAAWPAP